MTYPTLVELKERARKLRVAAKAAGKSMGLQHSMNVVARQCGDPNWEVLRAKHPETRKRSAMEASLPPWAARLPLSAGTFHRGTVTADWLPGVELPCYFGSPLPGPELTLEPWLDVAGLDALLQRMPEELRLREDGVLVYTNLVMGSAAELPLLARHKGCELVLWSAPFKGRWRAVRPEGADARAAVAQGHVRPAMGGGRFVFRHEYRPVTVGAPPEAA